MTARDELRALTSARGIAAWLVVLYHIRFSIAGLPDPVLNLFAHGYLAVDFFFLLSGFVIWLGYVDRLRAGGWCAVPEFLRRRIARIWPLHLVVLAGAVALALLFAATGRHDPARFPFAELPLHVLLLQNWGFTQQLSWNVPAWSISTELAAYLLFPLLVLGVDWRRWSGFTLVLVLIALAMALYLFLDAQGVVRLGQDIARFGLTRCIVEFAMGTLLCALWLRWRAHWRVAGASAALVAVALFAAWVAGVLPETLAVPVCFSAVLMALALTSGKAGNPLEWAPLHWLGEISYATYLAHYLLWVAFKLAFVDDAYAVPPLRIAAFLLLLLALSAMLYYLVERPAQRWINGLGRAARPARAATSAP